MDIFQAIGTIIGASAGAFAATYGAVRQLMKKLPEYEKRIDLNSGRLDAHELRISKLEHRIL